MTRAPIVILAVLGLAGGLGGCSGYSAPELTVTRVQVKERSPQATVLAITIDAENVNDVSLPLRGLEYEVVLDGKMVFSGRRSPESTLRRFGTQQIVVPAVVRADQMPAGGATAYTVRGTLRYTTPGELARILFDTGVERPSTDFESRGTADLSK